MAEPISNLKIDLIPDYRRAFEPYSSSWKSRCWSEPEALREGARANRNLYSSSGDWQLDSADHPGMAFNLLRAA